MTSTQHLHPLRPHIAMSWWSKQLALFSLLCLVIAMTSSCDKDLYNNYDNVVPKEENYLPDRTISIAKLCQMYEQGGKILDSKERLVIHGRVISNDYDGNFYTEMYIQDETAGIKISIGMNSLYAVYPVGSLIAVKANGLKLGAYGDLISLGVDTDRISASGNAYENDRIPMPLVKEHIFCRQDNKTVEPLEVNMDQISSLADGILVRLSEVQFIDSELEQNWADASDPQQKRAVDRHLEQKGHKGRLVVRTSGYARFANDKLPQGSGYIVGILTRFRSTRQLLISSPTDFQMNQPRFNVSESTPDTDRPSPNTSLKELRALAPSEAYKTIEQDLVLSAVIISDDSDSQFYKNCYIQDEEGYGLNIQMDVKQISSLYPFGTKVIMKLKGLAISSYEGSIRIGTPDPKYGAGRIPEDELSRYIFTNGKASPSPKVIQLADAKPSMGGTYVKVTDLFPKKAGIPWNDGTYNTANVYFRDKAGNILIARVSKYAGFAKEQIPTGPISITGVLDYHKGKAQITFARVQDVSR